MQLYCREELQLELEKKCCCCWIQRGVAGSWALHSNTALCSVWCGVLARLSKVVWCAHSGTQQASKAKMAATQQFCASYRYLDFSWDKMDYCHKKLVTIFREVTGNKMIPNLSRYLKFLCLNFKFVFSIPGFSIDFILKQLKI